MALSRPLFAVGHPLAGVTGEMDVQRPGDPFQPAIQRPEEEDVIVLSSDEEEDVPIVLSSDEEEDVEEDKDMEFEEEDEDSDLEEDWSSEESGYGSLSELEEDEDDDDGHRSPLDQEFPPEDFWHGLRRRFSPAPHPRLPEEQLPGVLPPAGPSSSEDPVPSTSGHGSTRRSREESDSELLGRKRPRLDFEGSPQEPTPSTSGTSPTTTTGPWLSRADLPSWFDATDSD